jgi:hypothetical protein
MVNYSALTVTVSEARSLYMMRCSQCAHLTASWRLRWWILPQHWHMHAVVGASDMMDRPCSGAPKKFSACACP